MDNNNPQTFHALETWYRKIRFRSRLEARWACFFHYSGIVFDYETQGYKLPDGTCYLPDFYLPKFRTWAEIKPVPFSDIERRKCAEIARGLRQLFLLLDGPPGFREYPGIAWDSGELDICTYSLDWRSGKPDRFFAFNAQGQESDFSPEYQRAVHAALAERFDGTVYPELGHEPFNLSESELLQVWGLL